MNEPRADVPIFDLKRHFETTITIGDRALPIRIRRFSRGQWKEFKKQWDALMEPRGDQQPTEEQTAAREVELEKFFETTIAENITLADGLLRANDGWVTTGDGLLDVFFARPDILTQFVMAVFVENTLQPLTRKNLNSPRDSATSSEASIPSRGGDKQGPTAESAESSSSAASAPAAEDRVSAEASPSSSGVTPSSEGPIVH